MWPDAKKMFRRLAIFSIPAVVFVLVIVAIDPFDFFGVSRAVPGKLKRQTSFKVNYALWKTIEYRRNPAPNILLGDSRMLSIKADAVSNVTGADFYNFAYGGGSLLEAIETFWFAAGQTRLESATFGINLAIYNAANDKNRVAEAEGIMSNPLLYFCNMNVLISTEKILRALVTGHAPGIGVPDMTPDEFWRHQLTGPARGYFGGYRYPEEYREELREIAVYCRAENVDLRFVVFPGHTDLQAKFSEYGLDAEYARFKADLADIAVTYDFEYENELSSDRKQYRDPFHFGDEYEEIIIQSIWGTDRSWVRVLGD